MTQQNFMSSRALTMEELVNVTGGKKLYIRFNSNGDIMLTHLRDIIKRNTVNSQQEGFAAMINQQYKH